MKFEILSLETSKKLANRNEAIMYMKNILKREIPIQIKMYIKNVLKILED